MLQQALTGLEAPNSSARVEGCSKRLRCRELPPRCRRDARKTHIKRAAARRAARLRNGVAGTTRSKPQPGPQQRIVTAAAAPSRRVGERCSASQLLERMVSAGHFRGGRAAQVSASPLPPSLRAPSSPIPPNRLVGLARAPKAQRGAGSGSPSARCMQRRHSVAFATSTDKIFIAQSLTNPRVLKCE